MLCAAKFSPSELLEGSAYHDTYAGGTFVHYMLPTSAYHRFHLPVSGLIKESFLISREVFMHVSLEDHRFKSSDSATAGYEFSQNRGVVTIDTSASDSHDIGVVAIIPVGMAHVASVTLTATSNAHMAKGEQFGYFQFGGSDIIICFQPGINLHTDTNKAFRPVGTPIAHWTPRPS